MRKFLIACVVMLLAVPLRAQQDYPVTGKITLWLFVALGVGYLFFRVRHRKHPRTGGDYSSDGDDGDTSSSSYDDDDDDDDDDDSSSSFSGFGGGDSGGGGAHSRF